MYRVHNSPFPGALLVVLRDHPPPVRPLTFRRITDQPAGFRCISDQRKGEAPEGKGRRRGDLRPSGHLGGKGLRKGRDRWEGRGGAHLARPLRPGRPAVLPPFTRSRRASPKPPRHQISRSRYGPGSGSGAIPLSWFSSFLSGLRVAPGCVAR